ncbi:secreted RxLR effector protein 78-like [Cryptomeria japonica]|uniref:secreted RxLR effector protein 78-like n=1 Tax=Cryptomeria japonica TaxID=3369 RepID=UPI0027DA552D|nr:secreted RxLR effector protein 78-like [Cryptomeria japonica]
MEWVKTSGQNVAMFLLDFEKAYERVEWGFILMMLETFGFPPEFCKWVMVLLKDASAQVEVNGSLSQNITLGRSIRQGCPLAPALFVIAAGALFYILRDSTISPNVKGIKLPNGEELINGQFADDTTLFIKIS